MASAIALAQSTEAARGAAEGSNLRQRNQQRRLMMDGGTNKNGGGGGGGGVIGGSGFWDHVVDQVNGAEGSEDGSDPSNLYGYDGLNYQQDIVAGAGFPGGVNAYPDGTPKADVVANATIPVPYGPPPDSTNGITYGPPPNNTGYTYVYVPVADPQPSTGALTETATGATPTVVGTGVVGAVPPPVAPLAPPPIAPVAPTIPPPLVTSPVISP